jgi:hypothetical protein
MPPRFRMIRALVEKIRKYHPDTTQEDPRAGPLIIGEARHRLSSTRSTPDSASATSRL